MHDYDVVISGMGVAGLAVAYEAAQAGKRVLVVSNRGDDFIRVQRIGLSSSSCAYLLAMVVGDPAGLTPEDEKIINFLKKNKAGSFIALKEVETFIYRRVKLFEQVEFLFHSKIQTIDPENACLTLSSVTNEVVRDPIHYVYLVAADGVQHAALDIFNQTFPDKKIEYTVADFPFSDEHVSAYLLIKKNNGKDIEFDPRKGQALSSYHEHRIHQIIFDVAGYQKHERKQIKCNFTAKLPPDIVAIKNEEEKRRCVLAYIVKVIPKIFSENKLSADNLEITLVAPSKKHGPKKDFLKFLIFQREIAGAENGGVAFHAGKFFLLAGDAFRRPNYQFSEGVNNAFLHAQYIRKLMDGVIDLKTLNEHFSRLSRQSDEMAMRFLQRENPAVPLLEPTKNNNDLRRR